MTKSYMLTTSQHINFGNNSLNGLAAALKVAVGRGFSSFGTFDRPITHLCDGILLLQGYSDQAYLVQGSQAVLHAGNDCATDRRDLFRIRQFVLGHQLDGLEPGQKSGRERCKGISSIKH